MILLVALRVTVGWHFFYEGIWKIGQGDEFSATPFLTQAKGPFAPLFYSMIPDLDGRDRLTVERDDQGQIVVDVDEDGYRFPVIKGVAFLKAWQGLQPEVISEYGLDEEQKKAAVAIYRRFEKGLATYLKDNGWEIVGYFDSLDRLQQASSAGGDNTETRKKRLWDWQQKLRREVKQYLADIEKLGADYQMALYNEVLTEKQRQRGPLPESTTVSDFLDFAVTWGLTAIGFLLMVGLCSRLAALGGAAFLFSVLLTQPPWPTIYPPAPEVVGHALIVDKNFVEMMALLALAALPVGRWAGLDLFLHRCVGEPLLRRCGCCCGGQAPAEDKPTEPSQPQDAKSDESNS